VHKWVSPQHSGLPHAGGYGQGAQLLQKVPEPDRRLSGSTLNQSKLFLCITPTGSTMLSQSAPATVHCYYGCQADDIPSHLFGLAALAGKRGRGGITRYHGYPMSMFTLLFVCNCNCA
jgi:hypothetical protein